METTNPIFGEILSFVCRCQNFSDDPSESDVRFDDGGFYFGPDDAVRSKPGVVGTDRFGRTRFHSYGSMTADGVRALIRCGLPQDHPRVRAARRWLEAHWTVERNPGTYNADREILRNGTYYYYCWSISHAMMELGMQTVESPDGPVDWATALSQELLSRQRADGSWVNTYTDAKEDDPLVATPLATAALIICRRFIQPADEEAEENR